MATTLQSGKSALFIQVDPTEENEYLTCVGVGAVTLPKRAQEIVYCPALEFGEFEPDDFVAGDLTEATMALTRPLYSVYNYLLELACRFNIRLNWGCRGDRPVLWNYELALLFVPSIFTTGGIDKGASFEPDDNARINTTGELKALKWSFVRQLSGVRQAIAATQAVNDINFLPQICYSKCSSYTGLGQEGYAVLDADYLGLYGDTVLHTENYGGTWTPTLTSPFTTEGRNANAVIVVVMPGDAHRVVVGGGPAGGPPEIGYSDDEGENWTTVLLADGVGRGINSLCRDRLGRIWAAADDGHIYVSSSQAETWSVSEDGVETDENLNDIAFYTELIGYSVGDDNTVLRTTDGATWDAIGGPADTFNLLSVAVNYMGHVFVTTNDARLFRSVDGGATWGVAGAAILDLKVGSINRVRFDPKLQYVGYLLHDDTRVTGTMHRSEDGGVTWRPVVTPLNSGLNALCVCDPNTIYIGGEPHGVGGTGFIAKFTGVA